MTREEAISRQAVLEMAYDMSEIDGEHFTKPWMVVDVEDIQKLPSVKSQEPKTGHWEWVQYDTNPEIGNFHCSECRYIPASFNMSAQKFNFCPNCGAKMESEANNAK